MNTATSPSSGLNFNRPAQGPDRLDSSGPKRSNVKAPEVNPYFKNQIQPKKRGETAYREKFDRYEQEFQEHASAAQDEDLESLEYFLDRINEKSKNPTTDPEDPNFDPSGDRTVNTARQLPDGGTHTSTYNIRTTFPGQNAEKDAIRRVYGEKLSQSIRNGFEASPRQKAFLLEDLAANGVHSLQAEQFLKTQGFASWQEAMVKYDIKRFVTEDGQVIQREQREGLNGLIDRMPRFWRERAKDLGKAGVAGGIAFVGMTIFFGAPVLAATLGGVAGTIVGKGLADYVMRDRKMYNEIRNKDGSVQKALNRRAMDELVNGILQAQTSSKKFFADGKSSNTADLDRLTAEEKKEIEELQKNMKAGGKTEPLTVDEKTQLTAKEAESATLAAEINTLKIKDQATLTPEELEKLTVSGDKLTALAEEIKTLKARDFGLSEEEKIELTESDKNVKALQVRIAELNAKNKTKDKLTTDERKELEVKIGDKQTLDKRINILNKKALDPQSAVEQKKIETRNFDLILDFSKKAGDRALEKDRLQLQKENPNFTNQEINDQMLKIVNLSANASREVQKDFDKKETQAKWASVVCGILGGGLGGAAGSWFNAHQQLMLAQTEGARMALNASGTHDVVGVGKDAFNAIADPSQGHGVQFINGHWQFRFEPKDLLHAKQGNFAPKQWMDFLHYMKPGNGVDFNPATGAGGTKMADHILSRISDPLFHTKEVVGIGEDIWRDAFQKGLNQVGLYSLALFGVAEPGFAAADAIASPFRRRSQNEKEGQLFHDMLRKPTTGPEQAVPKNEGGSSSTIVATTERPKNPDGTTQFTEAEKQQILDLVEAAKNGKLGVLTPEQIDLLTEVRNLLKSNKKPADKPESKPKVVLDKKVDPKDKKDTIKKDAGKKDRKDVDPRVEDLRTFLTSWDKDGSSPYRIIFEVNGNDAAKLGSEFDDLFAKRPNDPLEKKMVIRGTEADLTPEMKEVVSRMRDADTEVLFIDHDLGTRELLDAPDRMFEHLITVGDRPLSATEKAEDALRKFVTEGWDAGTTPDTRHVVEIKDLNPAEVTRVITEKVISKGGDLKNIHLVLHSDKGGVTPEMKVALNALGIPPKQAWFVHPDVDSDAILADRAEFTYHEVAKKNEPKFVAKGIRSTHPLTPDEEKEARARLSGDPIKESFRARLELLEPKDSRRAEALLNSQINKIDQAVAKWDGAGEPEKRFILYGTADTVDEITKKKDEILKDPKAAVKIFIELPHDEFGTSDSKAGSKPAKRRSSRVMNGIKTEGVVGATLLDGFYTKEAVDTAPGLFDQYFRDFVVSGSRRANGVTYIRISEEKP